VRFPPGTGSFTSIPVTTGIESLTEAPRFVVTLITSRALLTTALSIASDEALAAAALSGGTSEVKDACIARRACAQVEKIEQPGRKTNSPSEPWPLTVPSDCARATAWLMLKRRSLEWLAESKSKVMTWVMLSGIAALELLVAAAAVAAGVGIRVTVGAGVGVRCLHTS